MRFADYITPNSELDYRSSCLHFRYWEGERHSLNPFFPARCRFIYISLHLSSHYLVTTVERCSFLLVLVINDKSTVIVVQLAIIEATLTAHIYTHSERHLVCASLSHSNLELHSLINIALVERIVCHRQPLIFTRCCCMSSKAQLRKIKRVQPLLDLLIFQSLAFMAKIEHFWWN